MVDMKKYFEGIKLDAKTPLYVQLRGIIEDLIEKFPDGTVFPPERDLSELLGVNRRTIGKAIEPFIERGAIARNNKGTVISKGSGGDGIHPFVFDNIRTSPRKERLKCTLYENYPTQKAFWTSVAEAFNGQNPGANVELDWLPVNVSSPEGCLDYFQEAGSDIVQTPSVVERARAIKKCLAPLAGDIVKEAGTDKYWIATLLSSAHEEIDSVLPTGFVFPTFAWDCGLMGTAGVSAPGKLVQEKGVGALFALAEKLVARGVALAGHVEDYLMDCGFPDGDGEKDYERFFRDQFSRVGGLPRGAERWFVHGLGTYGYAIGDSMELFMRRKTVFSYVFPLKLRNAPCRCDFKWQGVLPKIPEGKRLLCGIGGLGVHQGCKAKSAAFDFLRFVLSEETQRLMPGKNYACSVMKRCNTMPNGMLDMAESDFNAGVPSLRMTSLHDIKLGDLLAEARQTLFEKLFHRTISVDDAVEETMGRLRASGIKPTISN